MQYVASSGTFITSLSIRPNSCIEQEQTGWRNQLTFGITIEAIYPGNQLTYGE